MHDFEVDAASVALVLDLLEEREPCASNWRFCAPWWKIADFSRTARE